MQIKIHNTFSAKKEIFVPLNPERITMYVCGPTVYGYVHIGNGRPAVVFDVMFRLLRAAYPQVIYARNITDVDDKINAAALANGEPISELSERFSVAYSEDVKTLGNLDPTLEPRATYHIEQIIEMIRTLIENGHAYEADGHVLFDVNADPEYGSLSHRSLADMLDGARVEVAPYKRDAKDFVLWKPSTEELPGWESPWGRGRPGWHIECSAMIRTHLGSTIDIHGGGNDLTFPHHENELAQGRCIETGAKYVRYWMHNGMLTLGNEKMSKSIGNIRTIRDLLHDYSGEVLRYALLSGQYRSPLAWTNDLLDQAKSSLDRLYQALLECPIGTFTAPAQTANFGIADFPAAVTTALADDLNTPQALAALHALAGEINKTDNVDEARPLRDELLAGGWLLGLLNSDPAAYFQGDSDSGNISTEHIERLIAQRQTARADKQWSRADEIRDQLLEMGIELEDTRDGARWKRLDR